MRIKHFLKTKRERKTLKDFVCLDINLEQKILETLKGTALFETYNMC